jgi:hypothetical protein
VQFRAPHSLSRLREPAAIFTKALKQLALRHLA